MKLQGFVILLSIRRKLLNSFFLPKLFLKLIILLCLLGMSLGSYWLAVTESVPLVLLSAFAVLALARVGAVTHTILGRVRLLERSGGL